MKLLLALLLPLLASPAEPVRTWQGIPGVERTPGGRIFVAWYSGGTREPSPENLVLLAYSDDRGATFTQPVVLAGPRGSARAFDPTLWRDPAGHLWYIFNRGDRDAGKHGVYARICDKPDARVPIWGDEFRVGFDQAPVAFRMNKPIVLSTGEWVLPVTHAAEPSFEWFAGPKQLQGVAISQDKGRTWNLYGSLKAPNWALENMVVELRDHRLWMLIRTGSGFLWESFSTDRGKTWSEPAQTTIANPGSRFFIQRLSSGSLLLVNHYRFQRRSHLTAQISIDEGKTWNDGLLLDERPDVSYPDGVQTKDGSITIAYDRDRKGAGEILLATFQEKDVRAGRNVSGKVQLRRQVSRLAPWDPKAAADRVMARLISVTGPEVKGAHDAEFLIVDGKAYIVAMANDIQPGESAEWPFVYCTMSVVNLATMQVERRLLVARGGQAFANLTLPEGAIFVPRILRTDAGTLRVFFASEAPRKREAQSYYLDFDLRQQSFSPSLQRVSITTAAGTFDMQPRRFYDDAVRQGFQREPKDYGLYTIDSFKQFDGKTYVAMNNYPGGQNGLAVLNDAFDTFQVLGHYNSTGPEKLTESAVNRLPDGTWLAICRQDQGTENYMFTTSADGRTWSPPAYRDLVPNGGSSKPVFEKFDRLYYLGWQESTRIGGISRSVFNIDVSSDGVHWTRKYRFETTKSFQYPSLHEYRGEIFLTATQGDSSPSRKERIVFGKLE
jgi:predicted neuraminidase